jgi:hypothetical protein
MSTHRREEGPEPDAGRSRDVTFRYRAAARRIQVLSGPILIRFSLFVEDERIE